MSKIYINIKIEGKNFKWDKETARMNHWFLLHWINEKYMKIILSLLNFFLIYKSQMNYSYIFLLIQCNKNRWFILTISLSHLKLFPSIMIFINLAHISILDPNLRLKLHTCFNCNYLFITSNKSLVKKHSLL